MRKAITLLEHMVGRQCQQHGIGAIRTVLWCIGFMPRFGFVDAPVFNRRGQPSTGAASRKCRACIPWAYPRPQLHTWGSG